MHEIPDSDSTMATEQRTVPDDNDFNEERGSRLEVRTVQAGYGLHVNVPFGRVLIRFICRAQSLQILS